MQGTLLATAIFPSNTPHAYNLTFLFPEIMFVVIAAGLYLRFRSRHLALLAGRRPSMAGARVGAGSAEAGPAGPANGHTTPGSTLLEGAEAPAEEAPEESE